MIVARSIAVRSGESPSSTRVSTSERVAVRNFPQQAQCCRCEDIARNTDHSIRCWLRSQMHGRPYKAPFLLPRRDHTRKRYRGLWKSLIYFMACLYRYEDLAREEKLGMSLSDKQCQAVERMWMSSGRRTRISHHLVPQPMYVRLMEATRSQKRYGEALLGTSCTAGAADSHGRVSRKLSCHLMRRISQTLTPFRVMRPAQITITSPLSRPIARTSQTDLTRVKRTSYTWRIVEELKGALLHEWKLISQEEVNKLVVSTPDRLQQCYERQGLHTEYWQANNT